MAKLRNRPATTTALYISGIPFTTIKKVKELLGIPAIGIQLRDIGNICWIEQRVVELLVDVQHVERMKNHINQNSKYHVKSNFDALSPQCFNWEGDIQPESKESVLKRNFVTRLVASVRSSNRDSTRRQIMNWASNRALGQQLEIELETQGIILPEEDRDSPSTDQESLHDEHIQSTLCDPQESSRIVGGAGKYIKRKFSILSEDSIER